MSHRPLETILSHDREASTVESDLAHVKRILHPYDAAHCLLIVANRDSKKESYECHCRLNLAMFTEQVQTRRRKKKWVTLMRVSAGLKDAWSTTGHLYSYASFLFELLIPFRFSCLSIESSVWYRKWWWKSLYRPFVLYNTWTSEQLATWQIDFRYRYQNRNLHLVLLQWLCCIHKWCSILSIIIPMIMMLMHVVKQIETYDCRTLDDDGFIGGW